MIFFFKKLFPSIFYNFSIPTNETLPGHHCLAYVRFSSVAILLNISMVNEESTSVVLLQKYADCVMLFSRLLISLIFPKYPEKSVFGFSIKTTQHNFFKKTLIIILICRCSLLNLACGCSAIYIILIENRQSLVMVK